MKEPGFLRFVGLKLRTLILVGCLLSLAGFLGVQSGTESEIRNDFLLSSEQQVEALQREIVNNSANLLPLKTYFESSPMRGAAGFDNLARKSLAVHRALWSLDWAPRIRTGADALGGTQLSKTENFPIQYVVPSGRAALPIGFDVMASPQMASAAKQAMVTGKPASTGKVRLGEGGEGIATFLAAYDAPDAGRNADWRAQHCLGLVIAVVHHGEWLAAALRKFDRQGIRTYIFDLSAETSQRVLYVHPVGRGFGMSPAVTSPEALLQERLVYAQRLSAGGRDWQMICVGSEFKPAGANWQSIVFLLCALAITCAVALYLRLISRYTHHLARANAALQTQVDDRQRAQDELAFQAFHDPLTGLPNRRQFGERFNEAIGLAKQSEEGVALFFVDLDGFKIINDTLGHAVGDAVLKAVGERLRQSVGSRDVVARTGGDEFNVLLVEAGAGDLADRVAQGLIEALGRPIQVGDRVLTLSASIGISLYPAHGEDFQELAHCADAAMYFAKKRGKNRFHRYTKELAVTTRRGMELALSLRGAIERNELCLFFQPIVGLASEPTLRFEALLRWRHPQIGLLGPGHFFSIAEETGLTAPIGRWVLHEACRQAQTWQTLAQRPVGVSVNASGLQFSHPDFMQSVDSALAESGLHPTLLEIEMSESAVVGEIEESLLRLGILRRKGVSVAIDDFGTGVSSLTYLETLPIDALKIHRSFLPRSESNFRRASLLRSLIALGRNLNLRVVVGGIEVSRQFELVRGMGPNEVQGFLFSKPLSAASVPDFIEHFAQKQSSPEVDRLLTRPLADLVLVSARSQAV